MNQFVFHTVYASFSQIPSVFVRKTRNGLSIVFISWQKKKPVVYGFLLTSFIWSISVQRFCGFFGVLILVFFEEEWAAKGITVLPVGGKG